MFSFFPSVCFKSLSKWLRTFFGVGLSLIPIERQWLGVRFVVLRNKRAWVLCHYMFGTKALLRNWFEGCFWVMVTCYGSSGFTPIDWKINVFGCFRCHILVYGIGISYYISVVWLVTSLVGRLVMVLGSSCGLINGIRLGFWSISSLTIDWCLIYA